MDAGSPEAVARKVFKFKKLRPGQLKAVQSVLAGKDTLVVMPTGSGKSAIYQIAGVMIDGTTVVISPLVALQRDQVGSLSEVEVGGAAEANSLVPNSNREGALEDFGEGQLEFLFLAPEQLRNPEVMAQLRSSGPSLFVVDEAHCVSSWGHDFRPDYLRLQGVIEELGHPTILALTATAAPPVRKELIERLGMNNPAVVAEGFDRPNIHLAVKRFHDAGQKAEVIVEDVKEAVKDGSGSGIVYGATRKICEEVGRLLTGAGVQSGVYHAGLRSSARKEIQDRFMTDDVRVIVATSAFGMGIDKPDVRFVFHFNIEESLDSYYQQIGRAGRDGEASRAVLYFRQEDLGLRRFFASRKDKSEELGKLAAFAEENASKSPSLDDAAEFLGITGRRLTHLVNDLAQTGALVTDSHRKLVWTGDLSGKEAAGRAVAMQERRRIFDQSRIEMMRAYAEQSGCRRRFLLAYFGEALAEPCGNCDRCDEGLDGGGRDQDGAYEVAQKVNHPEFGLGTIMAAGSETMVVLFEDYGYRTLDSRLVLEKNLLQEPGAET